MASYTEARKPMRSILYSRLLALLLLALPAAPAELSFNRLRFRGGTYDAKVNPFDWNTTLLLDKDEITVRFSPRQIVRFRASQVIGLSAGPVAVDRVSNAGGTVQRGPSLFGLLRPGTDNIFGIVYETEQHTRGALLLECEHRSCSNIVETLQRFTGKEVDRGR